VVAAGTALAVGYLVADLSGGPWPVDAVGVQVIDWAPGPVKDWAVRTLGTADRPLLRVGICATLAMVAAVAGLIGAHGRRRTAVGVAGALGVVGLMFAAVSRSSAGSTVDRLLPATTTLVVAVVAMALVVHNAETPTTLRPPEKPNEPTGQDARAGRGDQVEYAGQPVGFDRRRSSPSPGNALQLNAR
jgi:hypothetical protein